MPPHGIAVWSGGADFRRLRPIETNVASGFLHVLACHLCKIVWL